MSEAKQQEETASVTSVRVEGVVMRFRRSDKFWLLMAAGCALLAVGTAALTPFWWLSPVFGWASVEYLKMSDYA